MNLLQLNSTTAGRTAAAVAERALLGGVTFAVSVLLGRWGGPEELGLFAIFFPVLFIAIAFQESLIIVPYTVYVTDRADGSTRRRFLGSVLLHTAALGLMVAAVFALAGAGLTAFGPRSYALAALMLAIAAPCALMREFARRIVYAERNPAAAIVISGGAGALQLAAMALFYAGGHMSAASSFLAIGVSGLLTGVAWLYAYRSKFEIRGAEPVAAFRSNWDMGRWNLATQVSEIVRTQMFPWILALAANETSVGVYAACAVVAALPTPLLVAVSYVLLPEFVHERRHGGLAAANRLMWRATGWLTGVMALFTFAVAALSGYLVPWIYGSKFAGFVGVSHALVVLAAAQLLNAASLPAARALVAFQRPKSVFASHLWGIIVNLALGLPMVAQWGIVGAAYATLIASALKAALGGYWYWRQAYGAASKELAESFTLAGNESSAERWGQPQKGEMELMRRERKSAMPRVDAVVEGAT